MYLAISRRSCRNRRPYERIDGARTQALLQPSGQAEIRAEIVDISGGGVSLLTPWSANAGTKVQVVLPGGNDPVTARMVRADGSHFTLAFQQDDATLRRLDAALGHISSVAEQARAA